MMHSWRGPVGVIVSRAKTVCEVELNCMASDERRLEMICRSYES